LFENKNNQTVAQQSTIYLYLFQEPESKKELESIDLSGPPLPNTTPTTTTNQMSVINVKLQDLVGADDDDQDFLFKTKISRTVATAPNMTAMMNRQNYIPNVMMEMVVLDYLGRCNEKHYALMQSVTATRMNCKKLFYAYM
jgi:hypothetical protein